MHAGLALSLALLLQPMPALAAGAPAPGPVRGRVVFAPEGWPLAWTDVSFPDLRIGGKTDSAGAFTIRNVPPGRHLVRVALWPFFQDTCIVAAGGSASLVIRVPETHSRALQVHALQRRGRWPPRVDASIASALADAESLRACRHTYSERGEKQEGPWRTVRLSWKDALLAALRSADFEAPFLASPGCCSCPPEVLIEASGAEPGTRLSVCFSCRSLALRRGATTQRAMFGGGAWRLRAFAQSVFPDVPSLWGPACR